MSITTIDPKLPDSSEDATQHPQVVDPNNTRELQDPEAVSFRDASDSPEIHNHSVRLKQLAMTLLGKDADPEDVSGLYYTLLKTNVAIERRRSETAERPMVFNERNNMKTPD